MIDIKELRRLAQAATSGEWYVERGNHIYGRNEVTDGEEVWHPVIACTDDDEVNVNFEANAAFIAAANPAAVSEILDRLEAAESDGLEQARLLGMSGEREAALLSKLEAAEKERDALRAALRHEADCVEAAKAEIEALRTKIEAMERQEPAMWANSSNIISARISAERGSDGDQHTCSETKTAYHDTPLYLAPEAKP